MLKKLRQKIAKLETIEQKSFWTVGLTSAAIGIFCYIFSIFVYTSFWPFIAGTIIIGLPVLLMYYIYKTGNYHFAYPILCISIGAIISPFILYVNGGLHSGTPLFCVICSSICAFCYEKKWRYISFTSTIVANTLVFFLLDKFGTLNPLGSEFEVEFDIITSYYLAVIGMFIAINLIINEVRNYVISDTALKQYLDAGVRSIILENAYDNSKRHKGESRKAVILFVDISHFTTTTESMAPNEVADYLNIFLDISESCIHKNCGVLDKYIGDCAMAFWLDQDGSGSVIMDAIKAVFDMRSALYEKAGEIYSQFGTELNFSAGIDYGEVVLGDIGSDTRRDYTVIGDAVNTASRIEGFAAGGELLISERAADIVSNMVDLTLADEEVVFKGKKHAIDIYRVNRIDGDGKINSEHQKKSRESKYEFYICGCRGAYPVSGIRYSEFGGETSCYVLKKNKYAVVIDCGTGLQNAAEILSDCTRIDLLITHVHYDHIMGLLHPVFPRNAKIRVFGHFSGWIGDKTFKYFMEDPFWPVSSVDMQQVDVVLKEENILEEGISATFYRADHPNNGCVIKLMAGVNKICIFADCEEPRYLDQAIAMNADYLLYDGMYDNSEIESYRGHGHGTWQSGIEYAKSLDVKRLIITHHSPDNTDHNLLRKEKEGRQRFPAISFARSGDKYTF